MALQQFVCCVTVLIIFFCKGCHLDQPACGSRAVNSSNIPGLHDAPPGSWPWFAVINFFDDGFSLFSAGSLINDQWVLTGATIPTNYPSALSSMVVYLGRNSRSGPNPNEVNRTVVNITCHPGLKPSTRENYICLMKLSAPVNFTDYIRPICLASQNSTFNNETSSWAISFDDSRNNLQEANVPIVGNNECKAIYSEIPDNTICAGETAGPCLRSFGAPLMTQSGSVWLQSGVLLGGGCYGGPLVYTAVSQYQKWISDTVTGTPPGSTAPPTASPTSPTCVGVFCSGENLIHFTHFTSLCVLVVLLHVFAATVGN